MAFKMKGYSAFTKNSDNTVSTDLIKQHKTESLENYNKRKNDFVSYLQNNAGENFSKSDAIEHANYSNARHDSSDYNEAISSKEAAKIRNRVNTGNY